jgi:hypothetical protein
VLSRDFGLYKLISQATTKGDVFHFQQVNDTAELLILHHRQAQYQGIRSQAMVNLFHYSMIISTYGIHFVDEGYSGYPVFIGLSPNGFRLRFNPAFSAKYNHCAIQYAQTSFHFSCKINVPGCIYYIYMMLFPYTLGSSRSNGNTTLFFIGHVIHHTFTVVGLSHFMGKPSVKQYSLRSCGFTCINMRNYSNVAYFLKHLSSTLLISGQKIIGSAYAAETSYQI